jgi:small nuclear ribonucleoprotein (snRNP)-like protein
LDFGHLTGRVGICRRSSNKFPEGTVVMEESKPDGREFLRSLLNKTLQVKLTDGRILIGQFLCIDKDANLIIGSAVEYSTDNISAEPRTLGLAMIPGRHATGIWVL